MASALLNSGHVLLIGGSSREGRGPLMRVLQRGAQGWKSVSLEPSVHLGESSTSVSSLTCLLVT